MKEHKRHHPDPRRCLTQEQAEEIRQLRSEGRTQQSLADEYGVTRSVIRDIQNGVSYQ